MIDVSSVSNTKYKHKYLFILYFVHHTIAAHADTVLVKPGLKFLHAIWPRSNF